MIRYLLVAAFALLAAPAYADIAGTDRNGNITIFAFTCFSSKVCPSQTPTTSAGVELFTSSSAGYVRAAAGAVVDLGAQADSVCGTDTGTCTLIALIKKLNSNVTGGTIGVGTLGAPHADYLSTNTNLGFVNGVALLAGAGNTGTGSPRVTIATDQVAVAVKHTAPYPVGAVPYTASTTGTTAATTATLAGAASVTTYICGFSIRANATAAATANATVTGTITGTMNFTQWTAPLASGIGITEMIFSPCVPASGTNQSVAVVSAAPGTGGVVSTTAWGYKL